MKLRTNTPRTSRGDEGGENQDRLITKERRKAAGVGIGNVNECWSGAEVGIWCD